VNITRLSITFTKYVFEKKKVPSLSRPRRPIFIRKFSISKYSPCNKGSFKSVQKLNFFLKIFPSPKSTACGGQFSAKNLSYLKYSPCNEESLKSVQKLNFFFLKYSSCNEESLKSVQKLNFFFRSSKQH
jgi:hypothetical protein